MLVSLLRIVVAFVLFQLVREVIRVFNNPARHDGRFRPPPSPSPRTPRIQIDHENIVDATFEEITNQ